MNDFHGNNDLHDICFLLTGHSCCYSLYSLAIPQMCRLLFHFDFLLLEIIGRYNINA